MLRKDAKIELLRRVPLFSGCSKRELGEIASLADELRFEAGRTLIQEGKRGHEFIVVVEGTVEVTKGGRKLRARGDDTFFGELALLERRAAQRDGDDDLAGAGARRSAPPRSSGCCRRPRRSRRRC